METVLSYHRATWKEWSRITENILNALCQRFGQHMNMPNQRISVHNKYVSVLVNAVSVTRATHKVLPVHKGTKKAV